MKTQNLNKKQAAEILKKGGKVYLDDETMYLYAIGANKDKFCDQTGWLFTDWFWLYAPETGWNMKIS